MINPTEPVRCAWVTHDPLYQEYHDNEWGVPQYDPLCLFELLLLEGQQAGLNWLTVLKKRPALRRAYAGFNPPALAAFTETDFNRLRQDPAIIRNRLKIRAAIQNAKAYLQCEKQGINFADLVWDCVGGQPLVNDWERAQDVPVLTAQSKALSATLKKRGFAFVGPTLCYAFMQAAGMVNDHTRACFRAPIKPVKAQYKSG